MSELVLTTESSRQRVQRADVDEGGVHLLLDDDVAFVATRPDPDAAARVCRLATRVVHVELQLGAEPYADLTAVWHRSPHVRAVPVSAALALLLAGVATYVVGSER